MSEKKEPRGSDMNSPASPNSFEPKYEKPKILLVDMADDVEPALKAEGYAVESGSFGLPYKVAKQDGLLPIIANFDLPNHTEQELVIIDLVPSEILDAPRGEKRTSDGTNDWWVSCNQGVVDPRPRAMAAVQGDFDTILKHGGVFIIFATHRYKQDMQFGHVSKRRGFVIDSRIGYDNWSVLPVLDSSLLDITPIDGREMTVCDLDASLTQFLSKHIKGSAYRCTFKAIGMLANSWAVLAENKYKEAVSGVLFPDNENNKGWIFIFPQINNKAKFLVQFINEVLPDFAPNLFPYLEGGRWVQRPEYEIPTVLELKKRIKVIEEETKYFVI